MVRIDAGKSRTTPRQDAPQIDTMETKIKIHRAPIKKTRPYLGLSIALGLAGLIALIFLSLWIGLLVILIAALIDRPAWFCGMCGNKIEKTTSICPHCTSRIVRK